MQNFTEWLIIPLTGINAFGINVSQKGPEKNSFKHLFLNCRDSYYENLTYWLCASLE